MEENNLWDVLIIGGGLAGLTTALHLSQKGERVCLIEKETYPFHKVCGEYVSNEILPYLNSLGIDPLKQGAKKITRLQVSNKQGKTLETALPLGGFGISRYALDHLLFQKLKNSAAIVCDTVEDLDFRDNFFTITSKKKSKTYRARYVVGAFGKRSNLDIKLSRNFIAQKSPWLAVKNHFKIEGFEENTVALHNFPGGYCGLSTVENGNINACYLTTFKSFKPLSNIEKFQEIVMGENPFLKNFFRNARPVYERPLTISQISFEKKSAVKEHVFMVGDSAGLIHPLCGNGMAMAMRSAQIFCEIYLGSDKNNRIKMEEEYTGQWKREFHQRLTTGRWAQRILMNPISSEIGFTAAQWFPGILPQIIRKTHG